MLKRLLVLLIFVLSTSIYADNTPKILVAGTEAGDCQTGGLGEVLSPRTLPGELAKLGAKVVVVIPMWSHLYKDSDVTMTDDYLDVPMPWGPNGENVTVKVQLGEAFINGVEIRLISEPYASDLFKSTPPSRGKSKPNYSGDSKMKIERVSFFSKAVLELAKHYGNNYFDILWTNDWMTGLVPWYKKNWSLYSNLKAKTFHYIHNTRPEAQGIFNLSDGKYAQIDPQYLDASDPFKPGSLVHYGSLNITKGAIQSSDAVRTVDPQTAIDIMDEGLHYGYDLQALLKVANVKGFPHGIDLEVYNPYTGSNIVQNYDATTAEEGKKANKLAVQKWLGLEESETAKLIVATSRISAQKSHKEMADAFEILLPTKDIQIVIMGDANAEDSYAQEVSKRYKNLEKQYPTKFKWIPFEENKTKQPLLLAGADALMMFSTEEYGGLDQRKALVMGTIPIGNPINGIKGSTVGPDDAQGRPQDSVYIRGGKITADSVTVAIEEALTLMSDPVKCAQVRANGMNKDFSWKHSAELYLEDFKSLLPEKPNYTGVKGLQQVLNDCSQKKWTLLTAYKEYPELFTRENIIDFINSALEISKTRDEKTNILTQATQIVTTLGMKDLKENISKAETILIEADIALLESRFKEKTGVDLSILSTSEKITTMVDYFLEKNGNLESDGKLSIILFGTAEQAFADGLLTQMNNLIKTNLIDASNDNKLRLLTFLVISQNPTISYNEENIDVEVFFMDMYTSVNPVNYAMLSNISAYMKENAYSDIEKAIDLGIDITISKEQIDKSLKLIDGFSKSVLIK